MLTNKQLVDFVWDYVGSPYWYGTCGYKCSKSLLERKARQYPDHYGADRMPKYEKDIANKKTCFDCVGLIKSFFWSNGGETNSDGSLDSVYQSNNMPDTSANGLFKKCKNAGAKWGDIDSLPDVEGVLLFSDGHVGVYAGNGQAVEARGFNYGVCVTEVEKRSWKNWAFLPSSILRYEEGGEIDMAYKYGSRTLSVGMVGEDVVQLQNLLNSKGFSCGSADGVFGSKTTAAVKAFQKSCLLTADGIVGAKTFAALSSYNKGSEQFKTLFEAFLKDAQELDSYKKMKKALGE